MRECEISVQCEGFGRLDYTFIILTRESGVELDEGFRIRLVVRWLCVYVYRCIGSL